MKVRDCESSNHYWLDPRDGLQMKLSFPVRVLLIDRPLSILATPD
jgi:hypothetical protein